ncbi:hypothetical protein [Faecalibacterium hattorii]|uniref:hypothetical protein n=1 Tax=Faecalibacterium hattorii TaxID=2935520 RepID=UPI003AAD1282
MPDLVMDSNGKPKLSGIPQDPKGVYQGDGWKYEIENISDTLTLESGQYDFNYTSPRYRTGDHLNCVNVVNIVVQQDATIVGGVFEEIKLLNNGTVTNGLFRGADVKNYGTLNCLFKSKPFGIGYHSLTAADNLAVEVLLYSFGNTESFWSDPTIYFTGTPTLTVKLDNNPIQYINGEKHYGGLTDPDKDGYQTFTPKAGEDIVLNLQHYDTDLEMTPRGFPVTTGREPIYQDDDSSKPIIGYKGNGWKYENGTLTLESGEYDFTYTKPRDTTSTRHSNHVRCNVIVNKGAAITGGILNGNSLTNSGTVKDVLIAGGWITNNGTLSCLLSTLTSGNSFTRHTVKDVNGEYFFFRANYLSSGSTDLLYFTGTPTLKVKLLSNKKITCINGDKYYGDLSDPDEEGYQTFTPQAGDDVVLNREPYVTDLVMTTDGFPVTTGREPIYQDNDPTKQVIGCKGNGWKYEIGNVSNTLTLESGSYDFTNTKPITKDGDPLEYLNVDLIVNEGVTITGGIFWLPVVSNSCTIQNSSFLKSFENHGGTVTNSIFLLQPTGVECCTLSAVDGSPITFVPNYPSPVIDYIICNRSTYYFTGTPKFTVKLKNSTIHYINGRIDYGGLTSPDGKGYQTFTPQAGDDVVLNDSIIHEPFTMTNGYPTASNGGKTACKGEGWEYILGDPEHGDFLFLSNAQIDFSKISDGSPVECKLFIGHGVAVQGGTFNGDVINNGGGILGGTFNGAVENHGTIANGVFNGAVTNIDPGTVSDSITGTGTLNGKPITPNAYTLTVTGGGLVNDKTSAVVEAGDEVCLTVGEMQEGMSFNYWDLPTALTKALTDSSSGGFSNKVEPLTFTMPDLSKYTEDKSFTIRLDIRPAELPDDDDGPSVLGTMATVAVGGAAAGILVWQGVSLGVDSYLQLSLPGGVPVPTNRRELVKLLWETAGKPDVVLPALYGDVSAEDGELQKATRWAIDNGLVKPADESDASRFDPDRSVSKYEVARAWFKVQQMLK